MASVEENQSVLVTGATGFVGSHIVKLLQDEGYQVRGSVRSLEDEQKLEWLKELSPEAQHPLELVEADLTKPDTWSSAVNGCAFVLHVASPFPRGPVANAEEEVVTPAVEGTKAILQACADSGTVRRLVLTSSAVAIHGEPTGEDGKVYSEGDWCNIENQNLDAFVRSKTMAERAAWDFIGELPDDKKFELAVVNPVLILGPVLHNSCAASAEVVKRLLERSMLAVPKINFSLCDVRDVALAHYKAMTMPEAVDHRHIICGGSMWYKEMAQVLAKEFKPQGYSVPTVNCPYFALWVTGIFDKNVKMVLPRVGKEIKFDNSRMKTALEIEPRDLSLTLVDMAYSLIDHGIAKKTKKYKGPKKEGAEEEEEAGEDAGEETEKVTNGEPEKQNGEAGDDDDLKKETIENKIEESEEKGQGEAKEVKEETENPEEAGEGQGEKKSVDEPEK